MVKLIIGGTGSGKTKELIDQARAVEDDRESLIQLTEAFFRCLQAANHAGALDFDWNRLARLLYGDGLAG